MHLFHLKSVNWLESQLIYHAQPRVGIEGINILAPDSPYVSIGYHQNLEQEVDIEYCREHDIPIIRREVGGGAVFLDGNQIFYQIVLHKSNPLVAGGKAELYRRLLEPVAKTYTQLGIPAKYRPINDVITIEGRKISGTGAAEIEDYIVLVGNLIADFDYDTMAHVLQIPDEKFRDKVFKSMQENLTTIKREIGHIPSWDEMVTPLIRNYESVFGGLTPSDLPQKVYLEMNRLKKQFLSPEWLNKRKTIKNEKSTKIATGINITTRVYKAPGGLLRALFEQKDNHLFSVSLSGDFFCYPRDVIDNLETALEGAEISNLQSVIMNFYEKFQVESPGVEPSDWVKVLAG